MEKVVSPPLFPNLTTPPIENAGLSDFFAVILRRNP
jgi:hypothetical protein